MCDEIVISGISGKFPNASNVQEFSEKLFKKVYLVDENFKRFNIKLKGYPKYTGMVNNLDKFDAALHGSQKVQVKMCDPQTRVLTEVVCEAMFDAGYSPEDFKDSNTGMYVGCTTFDPKLYWHAQDTSGYSARVLNSPYTIPNKISYVLGLRGPSFTIDTACSSSFYALNAAIEDIKSGKCNAAIVASSNFIVYPIGSEEGVRSGVLAGDGISQPFDKNVSGYIRADAFCAILLQKLPSARRNYASILNIRTSNDGYKIIGATVPSKSEIKKLLVKTYEEAKVPLSNVNFIESHASSTVVGDKIQVDIFDETFCGNRSRPLKIGSVKCNTGHTEGASGLVSLIKALMMFENEKIIPNINIKQLRDDCDAFTSGRIEVPTEVEPFHDDIIGVDNFGILGANSHCIIRRNLITKVSKKSHELPRMLLWAGRTHESVDYVFDNIMENAIDDEFIALLQKTQKNPHLISTYRGYSIFDLDKKNESVKCIDRSVNELIAADKRSIVFVYSGVGSQWLGMGRDLMKIPLIKKAIDKCHNVLDSKNVNLKEILTSDDPQTFNNCLNIFVGVVAIQIALTKLLKEVGIAPEYFVGHSAGEVACAYADETLTLEETMMTAYIRGKAVNEKCLKTGGMAAIAMDYDSLMKILPKDIEVACHNSKDSFTVTGDFANVENFANAVKKSGRLAKVIDSSNVAFHSSQIIDCGNHMEKLLNEVIRHPKARSEKWISTSSTTREGIEINNKFADAEYFKNNLTNPVRFADAIDKLPENSFIVEIAPHSIMQGILMKNAPKSRSVAGLTQRDSPDVSIHLLKSLGKIFQSGVNMDISEIYPAIEFPVSRGTQMIAPLIQWDHSESHFVPYFDPMSRFCNRNLTISLYSSEYAHFSDHVIDGQIILPTSGYIELVWETFAMMHGKDYHNFPVKIENLEFKRAIILSSKTDCSFTVNIRKATGYFDICEDGDLVASGNIYVLDGGTLANMKINSLDRSEFVITRSDFYKKILRLRGYGFKDDLKLVRKIGGFETAKLRGQVEWKSKWAAFIDSMLHFFMADFNNRGLHLPTRISKVIIDTATHWKKLCEQNDEVEYDDGNIYMNAEYNRMRNIYSCGGVQVHGVEFKEASRREYPAVLRKEVYKFCPHFPTPMLSLNNALKFAAQIFTGSTGRFFEQTLVEIDCGKEPLICKFAFDLSDWGQAAQKCFFITQKEEMTTEDTQALKSFKEVPFKPCAVFVHECHEDGSPRELSDFFEKLEDKGMIILRRHPNSPEKSLENMLLLAQVTLQDEVWDLHLKYITPGDDLKPENAMVIPTDAWNFDWVEKLQKGIANDVKIICGRSDRNVNEYSGVDGMTKCFIQDYHYMNIRSVFINDHTAPEFDVTNPFYADHLKLRLNFNVYQNGLWGSYRHFDLPDQVKPELSVDHYFINVKKLGDLRSVKWLNGNLDSTQHDFVKVHRGCLNHKDILIATKQDTQDEKSFLEKQYNCGVEFSGVDKVGRKVIGVVKSRSISNFVKPEKYLTFLANNSWSFDDAATVPLAYTTVYLAFFIHADIQPGQTILIHSATDGLGQAAVRTALNYGLRVFATVGSDEKKKVLLNLFPKLCIDHIGSANDTSFEDMIMDATDCVGVDYVLNSLTGEHLEASICCVAKNGTFLEVGAHNIENGTNTKHHFKRIKFETVGLFPETIQQMNEYRRNFLLDKIQNDISFGKIQPLTRTVFDACDVQKAFKYLSSEKHTGKVLIKIRNDDDSLLPVEVHSRVHFNSEKSYIVTGGLGGLGVELCDWMVIRGCRKLVLASRRGISNSYQEYKIRLWQNYGAEVKISTADISTKSGCEDLIGTASSMGPVGGVFSLAAILDNDFFEFMGQDQFYNVFPAKVHAVFHLDEITRRSCPSLDHFLVFSSVASGRGAIKQSNYAMANSITERLVEKRQSDGLPGKSIQWGPISGVGMLGDFEKDSFSGYTMQPVSSCIELMDDFLTSPEVILSSLMFPLKKMTVNTVTRESPFDIYVKLVGLNLKNVDENSLMSDIGVDSLIATEFRLVLCRDYQIKLTMNEIRAKKVCEVREMFSRKID